MGPGERERRAVIEAPTGGGMLRPDTQIIAREGWYQVVTPSAAGAGRNEIVLSRVREADAERVIDEAIATYHPLGLPVKWCVGPWTEPAGFGARLEARGFAGWDVRGMACDTSLAIRVPGGLVIREVETVDDVERYLDGTIEGWGMPAAQRELERAVVAAELAATPRRAHLFVALADGALAGTTGLLLREGYGYLVGAQVIERARGRGVYRALVAARLALLRARGVDLAVTQAREATSAPMLEHLGFRTVLRSRCYQLEPDPRGRPSAEG